MFDHSKVSDLFIWSIIPVCLIKLFQFIADEAMKRHLQKNIFVSKLLL